MKKQPIQVVDGVDSETSSLNPDPDFTTDEKNQSVMAELLAREPLFHREEFGLTREDFEEMTEPSFWEVGASGQRYGREYVIGTLDNRYKILLIIRGTLKTFSAKK